MLSSYTTCMIEGRHVLFQIIANVSSVWRQINVRWLFGPLSSPIALAFSLTRCVCVCVLCVIVATAEFNRMFTNSAVRYFVYVLQK